MPTLPTIDLGQLIPPRARLIVYLGGVLIYVGILATDAALVDNPEWLAAALRALDFLAPLIFGLAAANVVSSRDPGPQVGLSHAEREARDAEVRDRAQAWGIPPEGDEDPDGGQR